VNRCWTLALVALPILAVPASGKGKPFEAPDTLSAVQGNADFAFDLYRQLASEQGGKNLFFSPHSLSEALAMTYAGARGATEKEMAKALHFTLRQEELHRAFQSLTNDHHRKNNGGKERGYELVTANALWGQKGFAFQPAFLRLMKDHYAGGLREADFVKDNDQARRSINDWVQKQTKDRVKGLFPQGVLNDRTRLVLTNATYFKAGWQSTFNEKATRKADFHLSKDKKVTVQMMNQDGRFGYYRGKGFQVLELPYRDDLLRMLVFLPDEGKLADFEKGLTYRSLNLWKGELRRTRLDVSLPRFEQAGEFRLDKTLQKMGMRKAFARGEADFSGIAKGDLFIQAVVHKAWVKVDEQGTEAAGATGVVIGDDSAPPQFLANRPFVFLIYARTGSVLFLGRVVEPK
jgi:serpin B